MAKIAQTSIKELASLNQRLERNYFSPSLMVVLDYSRLSYAGLELDRPFRMSELRILRCTAGRVRGSINLIDKELNAGMIAVVPEGTVIEIYEKSQDFCAQALGSAEARDLVPILRPILLDIPEAASRHINGYYELVGMLIGQVSISERSVALLIASLVEELQRLAEGADSKDAQPASRRSSVFGEFMELLHLYGETEHHVGDYAERLCITPNHLSATVKEESGRTVMWWIDRATIQHAKLMLRHTDLTMSEIADRLNLPGDSFFCRLFKRNTGMTPLQYRKA